RNRKTAGIFLVAAALVLALIFTVGHSLAANGKRSSNQTPATPNGSSSSADNGTDAGLVVKGDPKSGVSQSSDSSGSGGSTTTTPPTTTPPGGGGHRPPIHPPFGEVGGNISVFDPVTTTPTTTPPKHNPVSDPGNDCLRRRGIYCQ